MSSPEVEGEDDNLQSPTKIDKKQNGLQSRGQLHHEFEQKNKHNHKEIRSPSQSSSNSDEETEKQEEEHKKKKKEGKITSQQALRKQSKKGTHITSALTQEEREALESLRSIHPESHMRTSQINHRKSSITFKRRSINKKMSKIISHHNEREDHEYQQQSKRDLLQGRTSIEGMSEQLNFHRRASLKLDEQLLVMASNVGFLRKRGDRKATFKNKREINEFDKDIIFDKTKTNGANAAVMGDMIFGGFGEEDKQDKEEEEEAAVDDDDDKNSIERQQQEEKRQKRLKKFTKDELSLLAGIDQNILDEYDDETEKMEILNNEIYNKMYSAQPKTDLDFINESFIKHTLTFKVKKFFVLFSNCISHTCWKIVKSSKFENLILTIIIFNSIMLMLDDPTTDSTTPFTAFTEQFFLYAYTAEAGIKILAFGFIIPSTAYLKDGWNILDFTIVFTSLLPLLIGSSTVNLKSLRSLRILRPLRTISTVKKLKILLKTLFSAIPYLVNTMIILIFFFLIFAIGGLQLFGGLLLKRCIQVTTGIVNNYDQVCGGGFTCVADEICGKTMNNPQFDVTNFDNIFYSFLMVFQVITMEGWTAIMFQIFDAFSVFACLYFILIVFIGSFFLLNLTLAVIKAKFSDNQGMSGDEPELEVVEMKVDIVKEYRHMEREFFHKNLKEELKAFALKSGRDDKGYFYWDDLEKLRQVENIFKQEDERRETKLKKKLFVESWRKNQKNKIIFATKKINKHFKIQPQEQDEQPKIINLPVQRIVFHPQQPMNAKNNYVSAPITFMGLQTHPMVFKEKQSNTLKEENLKSLTNLNENQKEENGSHNKTEGQTQINKKEEEEFWKQIAFQDEAEQKKLNLGSPKEGISSDNAFFSIQFSKYQDFLEKRKQKPFSVLNMKQGKKKLDENGQQQEKEESGISILSDAATDYQNTESEKSKKKQTENQPKSEKSDGEVIGSSNQRCNTEDNLVEGNGINPLKLSKLIGDEPVQKNKREVGQIVDVGMEAPRTNQLEELLDDSDFLDKYNMEDQQENEENMQYLSEVIKLQNQNVSKKLQEQALNNKSSQILGKQVHISSKSVAPQSPLPINQAPPSKLLRKQTRKATFKRQQTYDQSKQKNQKIQETEDFHKQNEQGQDFNLQIKEGEQDQTIEQSTSQKTNFQRKKTLQLNQRSKEKQSDLSGQQGVYFSTNQEINDNNIDKLEGRNGTNPRNNVSDHQNKGQNGRSQLITKEQISEIETNNSTKNKIFDISIITNKRLKTNNNTFTEERDRYSELQFQKQKEQLQTQWLNIKIKNIQEEKEKLDKNDGMQSQAVQFQLEEKRLQEKEIQDREEFMVKNAKLWKLIIYPSVPPVFTSKESVMEPSIKRAAQMLLEKEEKIVSEMKFKVVHKLKVIQKKKPKLRGKVKKNATKQPSKNQKSLKNKSLNLLKVSLQKKDSGMNPSTPQLNSKVSGNQAIHLSGNNILSNDKKSVLSFTKSLTHGQDNNDKQLPNGSQQTPYINNSISSGKQVGQQDSSLDLTLGERQKKVNIPIRMSVRVMIIEHLVTNLDELSASDAHSLQNQSFSHNISSSQSKSLMISSLKKGQNKDFGKKDEKIDVKDFEAVKIAIKAQIEEPKKHHKQQDKSKDEKNGKDKDKKHTKEPPKVLTFEEEESIDPKEGYLVVLRDDMTNQVKSNNIYSGLEIYKNYKGGVTKLNKLLSVMNTDNQEMYLWISGFKGIVSILHRKLYLFATGGFFNNIATLAVFGNTVVLALDGSFEDTQSNDILDQLNQIFSYIFIVELGIKLIALTPSGYVRDKMNIFDGLIVSISLIEMIFLSGGSKAVSAFRAVRIFRTFRVLRVTRLLRGLQFMGTIVNVINRTLDSFIYIALLLFLFIFIFSLLGMQLYGGNLHMIDPRVRQNYDSFQNAFIATFQVLTIENWNDILYKTFNSSVSKFISSIFLIVWIFIGNWIFLNLFLAILLDGFTDAAQEQKEIDEREEAEQEYLEKEIAVENNNGLNKQNLEKLNQEYERMDSEEMEQIEQEILMMEGKQANQELFIGIACANSLYIFSKQNEIRKFVYKIVKHEQFENVILFFIIFSSLKLIVDTYVEDGSQLDDQLKNLDIFFNVVFLIEASLKVISFGFAGDENSYLSESWSQIDFLIVCVSLIDMSFQGINISFLKILRLLRTLRPLRFISHNVNLKVVVIALFESVSGIFNVIIVIFLIWLMFAILGISLIGTRMGYCSDVTSVFQISISMCTEMGKTWSIYNANFDNFLNSMRTLYIISSLEGWPDLMYQAIDSNTSDQGPIKDNYLIISYFYIFFILVGSFFLMNLFVGVIFLNFNQAQKDENQSSLFLTEEQKRWIEFQQMIIGVKAEFSSSSIPTKPFPRLMYKIVTNNKFEISIMILIVANIITMGMTYEGSPQSYNDLLDQINLFFTACFCLELIFKLFAFGLKSFWANGWNKFDLFVVVSSLIDITLNYVGAFSASFLRIGPQLIRIIRVFRVSRLLKLVKSMKGLQKLIETLTFSLPSLINVGALLLLVFFIYSVLGVFLFASVKQGIVIDQYNNFSNFGFAMLTLFRCSTGENWFQFMFDCGKTTGCTPGVDCGSEFSTIFFLTFILACSFIMLNLFILIIIQYFEDYHMKEDNPLQAFNDKLEIFRMTWSKYTKKTLGEKINSKEIVDFLYELPQPLGFYNPDPKAENNHPVNKREIARQVMTWALPQQTAEDGDGYVFFNDTLFACMRKEYGSKLMQNAGPEMAKMMNKLEVETRLKIAEKKKKQILKKNKKIYQQLNARGETKVNPMIAFMFLQMAFKAWNNFSSDIVANGKDKFAKTVSSVSESEDDDIDSEYDEENDQEDEEKNVKPIKEEDDEEESRQSEHEDKYYQRKSLSKRMSTKKKTINSKQLPNIKTGSHTLLSSNNETPPSSSSSSSMSSSSSSSEDSEDSSHKKDISNKKGEVNGQRGSVIKPSILQRIATISASKTAGDVKKLTFTPKNVNRQSLGQSKPNGNSLARLPSFK